MQPIRLTSPADLAAAVPLLVGFVPSQSVVVIALREPRGRVGLCMRVDLPAPGCYHALVDQLVQRLLLDGATKAAAVVYTEAPDVDGDLPCAELAALLDLGLSAAGLQSKDMLLVRDGRWWSYLCSQPDCCPTDGTPLSVTPAASHVAAEHALTGGTVLPSRQELVRSLAPPAPFGMALLTERFESTDVAVAREVLARGVAPVRAEGLALWRAALDRYAAPPASLGDQELAQLVVRLGDRQLRDEVLTEALEREGALFGLLHALVRGTPPSYDAEVCCLLAWTAALRGDGGLANVALDRALLADPRHGLSGLLRTAVDSQLPPGQLRALLLDVRDIFEGRPDAPRGSRGSRAGDRSGGRGRRSGRQRRAA